MSYTYQAWPSWRYGPNGESAVFESARDVPEGWRDEPSAVAEAAHPLSTEPAASADDRLKSENDELRADATRASELVAKFQAEREHLLDALDDLGFQPSRGDQSPVDLALAVIGHLKEQVSDLSTSLAPLDGDNDGKPGGLRGERKTIMEQLKAAGIAFKPTQTTDALRALLPGND